MPKLHMPSWDLCIKKQRNETQKKVCSTDFGVAHFHPPNTFKTPAKSILGSAQNNWLARTQMSRNGWMPARTTVRTCPSVCPLQAPLWEGHGEWWLWTGYYQHCLPVASIPSLDHAHVWRAAWIVPARSLHHHPTFQPFQLIRVCWLGVQS